MPRTHAISSWPPATRLGWVFFASMLLSVGGVVGRNWITYTHSTAYGVTQYQLGALTALAAALSGLAALSWTEQRPGRAFLESMASVLGFIIPVLFFSIREGHSAANLFSTALVLLLLFTGVRFASLVVVWTILRRLVLSTAPLCNFCGYDLTGNVSGVCSECGKPIRVGPCVSE